VSSAPRRCPPWSSDAAVEAYPGWGGYGAAKAALDQLAAVLAVEEPSLRAHSFDPGDMHTAMHQRAFPGEDIFDRPEPETVVPALLRCSTSAPTAGVTGLRI
jgi:NAD(P)-dependent dehydrogenase (short-subunit alcohol dehydrogenase family)